ncbi:MAG: hypothetical protein ACYC43_05305 [Burkholderiales bacterium]
MSNLLAKLLDSRSALLGREETCLHRFAIASRRAIGWMLIQLLLATVIMLPFNETANAGSSFASKVAPTGYGTDNDTDPSPTAWHNWVADPSHWITYPAINGWTPPVSVPIDNFTLFGTGTFTPGATAAADPTGAATGGLSVTAQMISGDKWITLGRETVGTAGISNQQISSAMEKFPKNAAYVFAQYSPDSATGRIVIQKVEKMPDGQIKVYQADFTPWSGELWKAQGKYRTAQEISSGDPGYNPFAIFEGVQTDPLFHNLSWEAMKVAVGHAMRHYGATFAFVALAQTNSTQNASTDNSLFSTRVTTTVNVYAQPQWYVATPMEGTPSGETGQICVTGGAGVTTSTCDDPAHIAIAGVMFSPWSGGNMPQAQDLMYSYTDSQSNWNVLFFVVIVTLITAGAASFLDPEILAADASLTSAEVGSGYAIASTVFGSGGSLLQTQKGFFGATGNGWEQQMVATGSPVSQQIQNGTMNAVNSNFVAVPMGTGGMTGTDALYNGGCPAGFSVQQCRGAGQDPGTIWRPDSYAEYNGTKAMRQRNTACTTLANQQNLQGDTRRIWIEKCAAPAAYAIQ